MLSFTTAFVAAAVAAGVVASPAASPAALSRRNTPNGQGTNNGFFYQFWDDGSSGVTTYTNGAAGEYSVNWQNVGDFTAGKGWSNAQPRTINFSGSVSASGNFYLAVYTWSTQGENYILEDYGSYNPCSAGTSKGTLHSDGSDYEVCLVNRGNNYLQNWSVRKNKRSSGTVTTANHYNYYQAQGMTHNPLSAAAYQIVSTEGFGSSGSAKITVSEASGSSTGSTGGSGSSTTTTASSAPTTGTCAQIWGQCGGSGWNGPTCCASGTCKVTNAWYSQCV
ncbi:Endo-1-4-beta-xylanase B [Penicillium diatomitis]|uniref:endo-1,4-beta-xylanase n=1 Tax=Penicillium diatomitis TaxID=2819901 RepID=A0A9W9WKT1_9EURO|nr:Endo-1-4-beta-xylanase B [Penicillium diatomitis]KAJ5466551.1 Endo-1-4-beta-xylanase B [Penicillium diatomitis]